MCCKNKNPNVITYLESRKEGESCNLWIGIKKKVLEETQRTACIEACGEALYFKWGFERVRDASSAILPPSIDIHRYRFHTVSIVRLVDIEGQAKYLHKDTVKAVEKAIMTKIHPPVYINDLV